MAVSIPREVFTLGAVQFNTQPLARLQGELMAKKAAKEEALDKYFNDLKGKITSAGMRSIDVEGFNKKVNDWISQGIANKSDIAKGGVAYQKHLEGYNSLLSDAELSKQEQKKDDEIAKLRFEDKIDDDLDFPIIQKRSRSIYDPEFFKNYETRQPYSIGDFSANIPAWDLSKRKQFIDFTQSGVKPAGKANEREEYDPKAMATYKTYDQIFTPQQIKDVSQKAIVAMSDKSGVKTYKSILKEGEQKVPSEEFTSLAKAYSMIYPDDVMNTPLKVAQADVILSMMGPQGAGEKTIIDYRKRASLRGTGAGGGVSQANLFDYDVLGKYEPEQKVTPDNPIFGIKGFTEDVVYVKDIPSEDLELITNNGAVNPITDQGVKYFKVRADGNWEGARGQVIDKSSVARSNLDKISLAEEKRLKQGIIRPTLPAAPKTKAKKGELD